jgi:DNA-binding transcriptional regulator YiaG
MTNLATTLKAEISRVARKEIRSQIEPLRKALAAHRADNAALRRRAEVLEKEVQRLIRASPKHVTPSISEAQELPLRFSAKGFASHRARLGLSAADCGLLLGASGQSIYNWESGESRPRAKHLAALAAFRALGKKDAATRLETLKQKD